MAKKLLVKTPHTLDGKTIQYDANKQVIYRKSIVELTARKNLESLNASLPKHLRHEFEEVEVEDQATGSSTDQLKKKLAELESEKENRELRQRIAELEAEKAEALKKTSETKDDAGSASNEGGSNEKPKQAKAEEVIAKVAVAETVDAVKALAEGDARKTVQEAATKRIAELEGKN